MGQNTRGIYPEKNGLWQVDKWKRGTRFRQRGFTSFDEAERWLIKELGAAREAQAALEPRRDEAARLIQQMLQILIQNGRVIDPASGFDGIADVAIASGRIVGYPLVGYVAVAANLTAIWFVSRIVMHGKNV